MRFSKGWVTLLIGFSFLFIRPSALAQIQEQPPPQKISIDLKEADLRNVLLLLSEIAQLNIVLGEEVKGRVTMRLNEVPWDQALEAILQSGSLGMVRVGKVIRIAPLEQLRKEEETLWAMKRSKETLEDLKTEMIRLKYARAKDMVPIVKSFLSPRGVVMADERTNLLIIRDISENIETIKKLFR